MRTSAAVPHPWQLDSFATAARGEGGDSNDSLIPRPILKASLSNREEYKNFLSSLLVFSSVSLAHLSAVSHGIV
jgi:hypothetical protein